ncbi:MAG: hypothetical protein KTR31_02760 [Myxococcales bacterium]|nr:hypothetical protein [Myxococcales bacterium]
MLIPVSVGEVVDKITILAIKERKISSEDKRANVRRELSALRQTWEREGLAWPSEHADALIEVNEALWDVEDVLRRHEAAADFGDRFVQLARSVYQLNDRRALLKRQINEQLGSDLVEEKDYVAY